jgi:hypothetical protein
MKHASEAFVTIPGWEKIPFLVHGFGNKDWQLDDFEKHPKLSNFELLYLCQIHSDILHIVAVIPEEMLAGDALLTDRRGVLLIVKTADCLPILIVDKKTRTIAAVHCGWKSTSQRLVQKVVRKMKEHFQCVPSSLMVALGPCIGNDCYEVGEDVKHVFEERGLGNDVFLPHPLHIGKYYLDLRQANIHQLLDEGVRVSDISVVDLCSHCEEELFSYRRSPKTEGRMLSFIGMAL